MNCNAYDDVLGDYVDGAPVPAFESHLAGCARCQALVADFSSLRRVATTLDEHVPPPRVWARISAAIDTERDAPWWKRAFAIPFPVGAPVAAAATLALLIGGAAWLDWRGTDPAASDGAAQAADPAVVMAEQRYEEAIAGLQQVADAQDNSLDLMTRAVLRTSLAAIDRAISESRAALSREPANTLAHESLLDALDTKVTLLQDTLALAGDVATDPDAAPGAGQELNQ